ncbi:MAG: glutamyl-tRNA reductase [Gammaproteobacteria bacterium]|nr:glutamyl-tRNA reductase [Gammaproteobacteria bacterium]
MELLAFGLNHQSAPVNVREQLAFTPDALIPALKEISDIPKVNGAAILSTCNRTELYCGIDSDQSQHDLLDWLANHRSLQKEQLLPHLYSHYARNSIRHLYRVASGLDSMVLGEPQILGQIKSAYHTAKQAGTLDKTLTRLFHSSFTAAKKVRTDTAIGSSPVSVAFAAVRLAHQIFGNLANQTVLLIGAGETIELAARHFHNHGVQSLLIANRSLIKAQRLASLFDGQAIQLAELNRNLHQADIIVSSTASQLPILGKGSIESAIRARKHKPMFLVDLAVPRDIEAEVEQLNDVFLYTVDDLQHVVTENIKSRQEAAEQAEQIIETQVDRFLDWLKTEQHSTIITKYRTQSETIRDEVLGKALKQLENGADSRQVMDFLASTLTNKLIHTPTTQIRQAATEQRLDLIQAAQHLLKISTDNTS